MSTITTTTKKWPTYNVGSPDRQDRGDHSQERCTKDADQKRQGHHHRVPGRHSGTREGASAQPTWHVDKFPKVTRRTFSIMEICTWTMLITTPAMAAGWIGWQPITIESGYDLTTSKGVSMAKKDVEGESRCHRLCLAMFTVVTDAEPQQQRPRPQGQDQEPESSSPSPARLRGVVRTTTKRKRQAVPR